ncbi:hypothetical protein MPH_01402 [Macrophomina phaseolina MS6]|uniref:Uncharacterized protein n=1 Tax=Macrophomina phaseolina (strain MS6) TaxID=1126212 RepID=K2SFL5_MACPH|nr:hypothetical protein MPH_01402 [Macrophomina phaseolina MS6]
MISCTHCLEHYTVCFALEDDPSVCGACLKARRTGCDVAEASASGLDRLDREFDCIAAEEDATLEKLVRLRKQRRFLQERRSKMIRQGFASLEELEKAEASSSPGGLSDPESSEGRSSLKRPRYESVDSAAS